MLSRFCPDWLWPQTRGISCSFQLDGQMHLVWNWYYWFVSENHYWAKWSITAKFRKDVISIISVILNCWNVKLYVRLQYHGQNGHTIFLSSCCVLLLLEAMVYEALISYGLMPMDLIFYNLHLLNFSYWKWIYNQSCCQ